MYCISVHFYIYCVEISTVKSEVYDYSQNKKLIMFQFNRLYSLKNKTNKKQPGSHNIFICLVLSNYQSSFRVLDLRSRIKVYVFSISVFKVVSYDFKRHQN